MPEETRSRLSPNNEISVREIINKVRNWFSYLRSKWLVLLLLCIVGGATGYTYALFEKKVYQASFTFALEDDKGSSSSGLGGALGLASSLGFDIGGNAGGAFSGANLIELMKSRRLVEKALLDSLPGKNTSLAEVFIDMQGLRKAWESQPAINRQLQFPPNPDRSKFTLQQDSVLGMLYSLIIKKHLEIDQKDKKASIISIDVKSESEIFSKYFAEAVAKEVSDFYVEVKSKKAKANVLILQRQTDSVRHELDQAITGVGMATDMTFALNPALNVKRSPTSQRQVDVQVNTAVLTQLIANLELSKVALRKETPLIQVIDEPVFPLFYTKPGKMKTGLIGAFIFFLVGALYLTLRKALADLDKAQ